MMSVVTNETDPQEQVTDALSALIEGAGGVDRLITPPGYSHLGLSILDAVYSLRSNYDSVVLPALQRYCAEVGLDWRNLDATETEHGAQALKLQLESWSVAKRADVLSNHVAPGTDKRKFDLCLEIVDVMLTAGVDTHTSLAEVLVEEPGLEWKVRKLAGVGPAAWRYILSLSRIEKVKPDTMIVGWVTEVLGEPVGQAQSAKLLVL